MALRTVNLHERLERGSGEVGIRAPDELAQRLARVGHVPLAESEHRDHSSLGKRVLESPQEAFVEARLRRGRDLGTAAIAGAGCPAVFSVAVPAVVGEHSSECIARCANVV